jgi:two-component system, LytTR family, response regulator
MAIKALIVDDERNNRENLSLLLSEYCRDVEVIGMAGSVDEALKIIESEEPDLVFLDIRMPEKDGFKLLERLDVVRFEVIIVTAYNQYAIQAIKFCAVDYLLKPIDIGELIQGVETVSRRISQKQENERLKQLIYHMNRNGPPERIGLASQNRIDFIGIAHIIRCEADSNYTHVYLDSRQKVTVSKTLKEFEELLRDSGFIRMHQSHLVNSVHIKSYQKNDGGYIIMDDDTLIPVSRTKKKEIVAMLRKYIAI